MLSILYSSYLYADLKLDESYSYPKLKEKFELNRNLNIDQLTYVDPDIENPQKPYKPKDNCMTAICKKDIVSMGQNLERKLKDYKDVNIDPSNKGKDPEDSVRRSEKALKEIEERKQREEKEKKEKK